MVVELNHEAMGEAHFGNPMEAIKWSNKIDPMRDQEKNFMEN